MKKKLIVALLVLVLVASTLGAASLTIGLVASVNPGTTTPIQPATPSFWEQIAMFFSQLFSYFSSLL